MLMVSGMRSATQCTTAMPAMCSCRWTWCLGQMVGLAASVVQLCNMRTVMACYHFLSVATYHEHRRSACGRNSSTNNICRLVVGGGGCRIGHGREAIEGTSLRSEEHTSGL